MILLDKYQKENIDETAKTFLNELAEIIFLTLPDISDKEPLFNITSSILKIKDASFYDFLRDFHNMEQDEIFILLCGLFNNVNEKQKNKILLNAFFYSILYETSQSYLDFMNDHLLKNGKKTISLTNLSLNNTREHRHIFNTLYNKISRFISKNNIDLDSLKKDVRYSLTDLDCFICSLFSEKQNISFIANILKNELSLKLFKDLLGGYLSKNATILTEDEINCFTCIQDESDVQILRLKCNGTKSTIKRSSPITLEENLILNFINNEPSLQNYRSFYYLKNKSPVFINENEFKNSEETKDYTEGYVLRLNSEGRIVDSSLYALRNWFLNYNNTTLLGSVLIIQDKILCITHIEESGSKYRLTCLSPDIYYGRIDTITIESSSVDELALLEKTDAILFFNETLHVDSVRRIKQQ